MRMHDCQGHIKARSAFTLIELLVVIAILGLAGALIVPAMGETGILRVQAAVRTIVSDITIAQSDAVAFQERRALVFDVPNSTYRMVQVPGDVIDANTNTMFDPGRVSGLYIVDFNDDRFGGSRITGADFGNGSNTLIFDGLGGPVSDASGAVPGPGGTITVTGMRQTFDIDIEAFTGRVTVERQDAPPPPPPP